MLSAYHHHFAPATGPQAATPPALLLLHGTGGDEHDLVSLATQLAPGAALLSPRGDVSEGGALRFFRRHAEGVFDLDDARRRAATLATWLAAATAHYGIDPTTLQALGFSNGANMAALLLQLHPPSLAGGVLLRSMVVLDQPAAAGSLAGRRVLLANGDRDPIVPAAQPPRLAELLRAGGAEVTLHVSRGAGHGLAREDLTAAQDFWRRR